MWRHYAHSEMKGDAKSGELKCDGDSEMREKCSRRSCGGLEGSASIHWECDFQPRMSRMGTDEEG
jgi:hypothetical protein